MTGDDLHRGDGEQDETDVGPESLEIDRDAEWLDRVTALPDESFLDDDVEDPELARLLLRWRRVACPRTPTGDTDVDRAPALVARARRRGTRVRAGPLLAASSVLLLVALGLAVLSPGRGAGDQ